VDVLEPHRAGGVARDVAAAAEIVRDEAFAGPEAPGGTVAALDLERAR